LKETKEKVKKLNNARFPFSCQSYLEVLSCGFGERGEAVNGEVGGRNQCSFSGSGTPFFLAMFLSFHILCVLASARPSVRLSCRLFYPSVFSDPPLRASKPNRKRMGGHWYSFLLHWYFLLNCYLLLNSFPVSY
jgi:hypothetical protein